MPHNKLPETRNSVSGSFFDLKLWQKKLQITE